MNKYELGKVIGSTYCIKVYKAKNIKTDEDVAVKYSKCCNGRFVREAEVLREFKDSSPLILQYIDFVVDESAMLITEYLPWCNLYQHIIEFNIIDLTIEEKLNIMIDISKAIKIIHNRGFIHNDIKPENILLDMETKQIKLIDFGAIAEIGIDDCYILRGSVSYTDPLMIKKQGLKEHDIYSLGVVFDDLINCECLDLDYPQYTSPIDSVYYMYDKTVERINKFKTEHTKGALYNIINLISSMVSLTISDRPNIDKVIMSLETIKNNL